MIIPNSSVKSKVKVKKTIVYFVNLKGLQQFHRFKAGTFLHISSRPPPDMWRNLGMLDANGSSHNAATHSILSFLGRMPADCQQNR